MEQKLVGSPALQFIEATLLMVGSLMLRLLAKFQLVFRLQSWDHL